jgi:hypothetical protein
LAAVKTGDFQLERPARGIHAGFGNVVGETLGYGARADIPDADGMTAAQIMARKKDDRFRKLAEKLGAAPRPRGRRSA